MKTIKIILSLFVLVAVFSTGVFAQVTTVNATAEVLNKLEDIPGNRSDLEFGNVTQGVVKSIAKTDESSASWGFSGTASAGIILDFTLPTNLEYNDGVDTHQMPISFSGTDAGHDDDGTIATQTDINPNSSQEVSLDGDGEIYIWLGGTVAPATTQQAGSYTGTITLTVSYQ